jgi:hypothetical protein
VRVAAIETLCAETVSKLQTRTALQRREHVSGFPDSEPGNFRGMADTLASHCDFVGTGALKTLVPTWS